MKRIAIESLRISNFKGVKTLVIAPGCADATIRGDNGTGKTTVADAVSWLLFNRDSHGKTDFQLKPVGADGQEIHNLETEVEGTFSVDGKPVALRKRFQERWVKKRGSVHPEFQGHTTDYFIDSVPAKLKEFTECIKSLVDDSLFKLLTSPIEFASLHWQERRRILMEICGEVTDEAVFEQEPELKALTEILSGCSPDDHRKKLVARRKDVNKEIQSIPVRISELSRIEPAIKPDVDKKARLEKKLAELRDTLAAHSSNAEIAEKQTRIHEIDGEIIRIKNSGSDLSEQRRPIQAELDKLFSEKTRLTALLRSEEDNHKHHSRLVAVNKPRIAALRQEWFELSRQEAPENGVCHTCGQKLPEQMVKESLSLFNNEKAERLKVIQLEGKEVSAAVKQYEDRVKTSEDEIADIKKAISSVEDDIKRTENELAQIRPTFDAAEVEKLTSKKNALQMEIDAIKSGSSIREKDTRSAIQETEAALAVIAEQEAAAKAFAGTQERIHELSAQEKALSSEYERIEYELNLLDRFTVAKVNLLESSINSKFALARFKLFREQINGGIEECCEILSGGVPVGRGLNTGASINVGLDIINTLAGHYGVSVPVFVDNAEAVTSLIETKSQLIRLVVDPDAQTLTHDDSIKKTA